MMINEKRAIVLLSGGLDSATVLAMAQACGFTCYAVAFNYGQRHHVELNAAKKICAAAKVDLQIINLDLRGFTRSSLTAHHLPITPTPNNEIPNTYVPARNLLFLSYALGVAETLNAHDIFIGVNAVDYSGYPDCRPEFIAAFTEVANLATVAGINGEKFTIHAPLSNLSKAEIIQCGIKLNVNYALTHSCYQPDKNGVACGICDSCNLRRKGFSAANIPDPTTYAI